MSQCLYDGLYHSMCELSFQWPQGRLPSPCGTERAVKPASCEGCAARLVAHLKGTWRASLSSARMHSFSASRLLLISAPCRGDTASSAEEHEHAEEGRCRRFSLEALPC